MTGNRIVVFVDDDSTANVLVLRLFSKAPFDLHAFTQLDEAREFISTNPVFALIVDLRMPLISGIEFLKSLDLPSREVPIERVILQTGAAPEERIREEAESLGYQLVIKEQLFKSSQSLTKLLED